jgi:hypothetical protein
MREEMSRKAAASIKRENYLERESMLQSAEAKARFTERKECALRSMIAEAHKAQEKDEAEKRAKEQVEIKRRDALRKKREMATEMLVRASTPIGQAERMREAKSLGNTLSDRARYHESTALENQRRRDFKNMAHHAMLAGFFWLDSGDQDRAGAAFRRASRAHEKLKSAEAASLNHAWAAKAFEAASRHMDASEHYSDSAYHDLCVAHSLKKDGWHNEANTFFVLANEKNANAKRMRTMGLKNA